MTTNKRELRQEFLQKQRQLSAEQRHLTDLVIAQKIIWFLETQKVTAFCIYVGFGQEVATKTIIDFAFNKQIAVYVPKVLDQQKMLFYKVESWDDLVKTERFAFLEPVVKEENLLTDVENIPVVFIPLTVFDQALHRVGSGYGYYDRWLTQTNFVGLKIGLAREVNFSATKIIIDDFDVPMDVVVTEKNIHETQQISKISLGVLNDWKTS